MRIPEAKPHAREGAHFLVGASRSVVVASMLRPTCLWALSCQAHMSVALVGNKCCVASFFTKPNGLHIPSPFFPLPTIRPFAFLPTSPHPFAVIALSPSFCLRPYRPEPLPPLVAGDVWCLRDPSPTFLRRCSPTSPPVSRPCPRTPWMISVTSGALALS